MEEQQEKRNIAANDIEIDLDTVGEYISGGPKIKTKNAAAKRIEVTGSGKLMRNVALHKCDTGFPGV